MYLFVIDTLIFWDEPVKQNIYYYLHSNFSFYCYCFVLVLDIAAEGKYFLLVNICGQNIDTPTFYSGLLDSIQEIYSTQHIPLVGDFNLILNKILDSKNNVHTNNPKSRSEAYKTPIKQARLDFFSKSLNPFFPWCYQLNLKTAIV